MEMVKASPSQSLIDYKDLSFRLIACLFGAHIIITLGEGISTFKAFTIKSYYPVLAINYGIALILAWIVRRITIKLDKHYNWETNLWWRFLLQFFFGVVVVSIISFLLVFIYFRSFGQSIMDSTYPTYQFPLSVALLALLNSFYVVYYFYHRVKFLSETLSPGIKSHKAYINVLDGTETVSLPTSEIAYIYIVEKGVLVKTNSKKDYLCDFNLDELESQLDPAQFFRINRKLIAHRTVCKSYQPLDYGKLEVTLVPVPVVSATVSQRKAGAFKEWMR